MTAAVTSRANGLRRFADLEGGGAAVPKEAPNG